MPVRQDITVLPADNPKKLRLGWIIVEEVGVAVINDHAISKILCGNTAPPCSKDSFIEARDNGYISETALYDDPSWWDYEPERDDSSVALFSAEAA